MRSFLRGIVVLFFFQYLWGQSGENAVVQTSPVIVTAFRTPLQLSAVNRSVDVLDAAYYGEKLGTLTLEDVVQKIPSVSVQARAPFGVQTDLSIRGSLFSQQLVLLNGSRLNDPQTAHHTMNMPVGFDQIERVEVIKGPLSVLYGPDAYGGVVNVVTKIPQEESLRFSLRGGEYGFFAGSASYAVTMQSVSSSTVIEHRQSDGYRSGTEFQVSSLSNTTTLPLWQGTATLTSGYTVKDFGAANFYGPAPSKERTETLFLQAGAVWENSVVEWKPRISYRRNFDRFQYNRQIPDRFINTHTSHLISAELQGSTHITEATTLVFGAEGTADRIYSSNLKNHQRSSLGIFLSVFTRLSDALSCDGGLRGDIHSAYSSQLTPSVSISYLVLPSMKLYSSVGKSFRAPSYTELYYTSPSRIGNAHLQPEEGWSYEVGAMYFLSTNGRITLSGFQRSQTNLIDYVKYTPADAAYTATNFTRATTRGIELQYEWRSLSGSTIEEIQLGYSYLDSYIDRRGVFSSLYTLIHPRHQLQGHVITALPYDITASLSVLHKLRTNRTTTTLVDGRLSYAFPYFVLALQGTNILNETYEEVVGVQLPGRWLWAEVQVKVW